MALAEFEGNTVIFCTASQKLLLLGTGTIKF